MSEEKKPKKAKTSSTKKATTAKTPAKKKTSTKKTTSKKVAKEKVEKVTPVEEQEINIVTELPEYQVPVEQEENNMNNEEIKVTESNEEVVIPTSEPIVFDTPTVQVNETYQEPVEISEPTIEINNEPVNEGYRATRLNEINNYQENNVVNETSFQYEAPAPVVEPVSIEENNYVEPVNVYEEPKIEENTYSEVTPAIEPMVFTEPNAVIQEEKIEPQVVEPVNTYEEPTIEENTYSEVTPAIDQMVFTEPNAVIQEEKIEPQVEQKPKVKRKKDVKSILLVLLFIFLFAFIMGMPYINEFLDTLKKDAGLSEIEKRARTIEKEQQKQNPKAKVTDDGEVVKDKLTTLTCTSETTALENYSITVVETFEYNSKGQVLESSKTTTYKFTTQTEKFNSLKTECNENALKYVEKKGYEVACSYNDTEVETKDKFDLSTFTTINDGMTTIEANAKYLEKIDTVKKRMAAANYTCE